MERLKSLIEKWRQEARVNAHLPLVKGLLDGCADELQEALEIEQAFWRG